MTVPCVSVITIASAEHSNTVADCLSLRSDSCRFEMSWIIAM